jgi:hypothetical protein
LIPGFDSAVFSPAGRAALWARFYTAAPLAHEAVRRIDLIFDAEREINGLAADKRLGLRQTHVASLVADLEDWRRAERAKFSRHNDVAKAMDYVLKRWPPSPAFWKTVASASPTMRRNECCAVLPSAGRLGCSPERAATMYSLIITAKLNDVDPQAWLADVLRRINDHSASRLDELLPWNWKARLSSRKTEFVSLAEHLHVRSIEINEAKHRRESTTSTTKGIVTSPSLYSKLQPRRPWWTPLGSIGQCRGDAASDCSRPGHIGRKSRPRINRPLAARHCGARRSHLQAQWHSFKREEGERNLTVLG